MPAVELIAACWTTAGECRPGEVDDRSPLPIRARVEAAALAGFRGFGIRHGDLLDVERGPGFPWFRRLLDDNGIVHLELEFLEGWYAAGPRREKSDEARTDLLRAAEILGARHIKIGAEHAGGVIEPARMVEEFAALAAQAAAAGTRVGLEPMPFTDIRTPAEGLEVVSQAGHRAGGLFVDVWHVGRAGIAMASLAALPSEHLLGVELDDADAQVRGSLFEDTLHERRFPGEGALDVAGFVNAIRATGFRGPWGVEMLSRSFRALPVAQATQRAFDTSRSFLAGPDMAPGAR